MADIDNDGKLELIFGSFDYNIYAINSEDGSEAWSFPTEYFVTSSPVLGDVDNDSKLEVIIGSKDDKVYALNAEDGSKLWSYTTDDEIEGHPVLGDKTT